MLHELGHNLNLAHSGEGGAEYADQSGYMGYSYGNDDVPKMCYNAAKSWQLGWYQDKHKTVNPLVTGWEGYMVGIVDYNIAMNGESVLLQVDTGSSTDYYVNYNRAAGFNSETQEGVDQLMVVTQGSGYSQSWLVSKMNPGESYTIANFGGTSSSVTITLVSVNTTGPYNVARVKVLATTPPPTPPTPAPTRAPTVAKITGNRKPK